MADQTPTEIAARIRGQIHAGTLTRLTLIGTEEGLAEQYGVPVDVMRSALEALREEELILQRQDGPVYVGDVDHIELAARRVRDVASRAEDDGHRTVALDPGDAAKVASAYLSLCRSLRIAVPPRGY